MIVQTTERMIPPAPAGAETLPSLPIQNKRRARRLLTLCLLLFALGTVLFFGWRVYRLMKEEKGNDLPTAKVQRGDLVLNITARGELRGGNPQSLTAPMTGGTEMHITQLRKTGEEVRKGDLVAQFDITEQQFKLKEAEADLAEAEQNLIKAQAQREADQEEDRYALLKAKSDLQLAELDVRKNPLLSAIAAQQNDLALEGARDHLAQTEKNLSNRRMTGEAGIAIQQAGREKAQAQAATARQNIEAMTLRADRAGYVAVKPNSATNFFFTGMTLPFFQVGDTVRPGMAVAEIPDMKNWELAANVGELDRGHLQTGNKVKITIIAVPGHFFQGHVKELGGMTGPFWDRHFECKISLDDPTPELRPGMSAQVTVTTDELKGVLSLPAQALFESDGRTFVYVRSGAVFTPRNIQLIRRNETRAVVDGLTEGDTVALANPIETAKKKETTASPLKSVGK